MCESSGMLDDASFSHSPNHRTLRAISFLMNANLSRSTIASSEQLLMTAGAGTGNPARSRSSQNSRRVGDRRLSSRDLATRDGYFTIRPATLTTFRDFHGMTPTMHVRSYKQHSRRSIPKMRMTLSRSSRVVCPAG